MSSGLTSNQLKSTTINGSLSIVDYGSTTGILKTNSISPNTNSSITISGVVYIPFLSWSSFTIGYYDQFAAGYGSFLDQFT